MDMLNVVILGLIEGITEFLPVSSTGHLLIAEHWLGERSETFNVVIQAGAILAVTIIYWRRIVDLVVNWKDPLNRSYAAKLIVAFLITAALGLVAKKLGFALPEAIGPVAWALIIGGVWILAVEAYVVAQGRHPLCELADRRRGRLRPDRRGRLSGNLALGRDHLRRHAGRHDRPGRSDRILVSRQHPDHVCGERL